MNWLSGQGSPQLFVYHQPPQKITESGEVTVLNARDEFYITNGKFCGPDYLCDLNFAAYCLSQVPY
jgi:hypothetical protein